MNQRKEKDWGGGEMNRASISDGTTSDGLIYI